MSAVVPVISLKGLGESHEQNERIAQVIGSACRNSGFFQIVRSVPSRTCLYGLSNKMLMLLLPLASTVPSTQVDHGISADLISKSFAIAEKVFSLPLAEKAKYARNPKTNRGFDLLGSQSLDGAITGHEDQADRTLAVFKAAEDQNPDMKEGWMVGPDGVDVSHEYWGRFGHGPNSFPPEDQVPSMKTVMKEYYEQILSLAQKLMRLVALSLELPENTFDSLCREPAAAIRLLHYPAETKGSGAGAHSDFGLITLLTTSGAPGLELWSGGEWIPVEPTQGAYIVNVGDILQLYTGGEYKSSLHRVMNHAGVDRYSIPFFLDGNSDILVAPVRGPGVGKMKAVTVEEHLRERFDGSYFSETAASAMKAAA